MTTWSSTSFSREEVGGSSARWMKSHLTIKMGTHSKSLLSIGLFCSGPDSKGHQFSCVCLHGDRKPNERKNNLERFKVKEQKRDDLMKLYYPAILNTPLFVQRKEVRLLICTDVAARGIDIHGVPYGKTKIFTVCKPTLCHQFSPHSCFLFVCLFFLQ